MSEHTSARSCPYLALFFHCADALDTSEHIGAHQCPVCPYLCLSTPCGRTGHERAHRCSSVSCMSISLSLQNRADVWDTSKVCLYSCSFGTMRTHRSRASTLLLTCVLYVPILVLSTLHRCTGHERVHRCSLVSCMSVSLSLQHCADVRATSEHTGVCPCPVCPYPCPFDAIQMYKT